MPDLLALNGQIIGGVPLPGENYIKLWENPNPIAAFIAQDITLSSDDYDFLMVEYTANVSWATKHNYSTIVEKGVNIGLQYGPGNGYTRLIKPTNNTTLEVQIGYEGGSTTSNNVCVPLAVYGIKKDALAAGSGGAGGGHIIEDAEGTDLDQQDTLQFKGTLRATNDSTNGKTIVDDSAVEIEWDDWQAMTEQEREAYLAENPKVDILNFPDADADLQFDFLTKLWENSDTSASFAGQTITLASDDYDFLLMIAIHQSAIISGIAPKGKGIWLNHTNSNITSERRTLYVSDTSLNIQDATSNGAVNNSAIIPIAIYGFKQKITLTVDAIAENVSTSASKCMVDEDTSVAQALDNAGRLILIEETSSIATNGTATVTIINPSKIKELVLVISYQQAFTFASAHSIPMLNNISFRQYHYINGSSTGAMQAVLSSDMTVLTLTNQINEAVKVRVYKKV